MLHDVALVFARVVQQCCARACPLVRCSIPNMSHQGVQMRATCCTQQCCVKARLHRRFLSRQLDAIFVAPKLQLQNRTCKQGAICRRDIARVSNMFETCCNFSATKIASSCCDKNRLCKRAFMLLSNVAIVWPELVNAGPTILGCVVLKCGDRSARALARSSISVRGDDRKSGRVTSGMREGKKTERGPPLIFPRPRSSPARFFDYPH